MQATVTPPAAVAAAARRGLELRASQPPSNRCCTSVGLRRASQLANRQPVSESTLKRMASYFSRHAVDAQGKGWRVDSKGWQAWLLWGGDEAVEWLHKLGYMRRNPDDRANASGNGRQARANANSPSLNHSRRSSGGHRRRTHVGVDDLDLGAGSEGSMMTFDLGLAEVLSAPAVQNPDDHLHPLRAKLPPHKDGSDRYSHDVATHFHLGTGGYSAARYVPGSGWRVGGAENQHVKSMALEDVYFAVNKAGREETERTGVRNVHALVYGRPSARSVESLLAEGGWTPVTYRPAPGSPLGFFDKATNKVLDQGVDVLLLSVPNEKKIPINKTIPKFLPRMLYREHRAVQKNPFSPAVAKGLYARMVADGATTFAKKVSWVKKHIPDIDDPASFVAVLVRQEEGMATKKAATKKAATKKAAPKRNPRGGYRYTVVEETYGDEGDAEYDVVVDQTAGGLPEAVRDVRDYGWIEWDSMPPRRGRLRSEAHQDLHTGDYTSHSLSIERADGKPLSQEELAYIDRTLKIGAMRASARRNPAAPKKAAPKHNPAAPKKAAAKKAAPKRNPGPDEHKARARQSLQTADDMFFEAEGMSHPERKIAAYMHSAATANAARQDFADASDGKGVKDAQDLFRRAREEALEVVGGLKSRNPGKTVESHNFCVHAKDGRLVAYTTTLAEAQSVMPKGGHIKPLM